MWNRTLDRARTSAFHSCEELWKKLCEQAVVEQDSENLLELAREINRQLGGKEERLKDLKARCSRP